MSDLMETSAPEQWPSVDVAYDFVIPSYQMLTSRFESADSRLTSLLTIASSLTVAAPLFGKALRPDISFESWAFVAALALFGIVALVGLAGRIAGVLTLPDPMVHYNKSLHLTAWTFKKDAIYLAGKHFQANAQAINRKGKLSIIITLLLTAEILTFVVWISLAA